MACIKIRKSWELPDSAATPEHVYMQRREFIARLGLGSAALVLGCSTPSVAQNESDLPYPAPRNDDYTVEERGLTPEELATRYNNYYEFTTTKDRVWRLVGGFEPRPWSVEVGGLCAKPQTFDIEDIERHFELEERVYRFRCVEAWAMTVPWTGFPLARLLERVEPSSEATYVRFWTVNRPEQMPGMREGSWASAKWPYYEGLRIDEAMHDLTLLTTGLYGKPLPVQNGAPVRLIVPWKYGFKSIKSIVRIELTAEQPPTFWNDFAPDEYGFLSNVDPDVPHPRWSQATERLIETGERVPTRKYNGYADDVAHLYT